MFNGLGYEAGVSRAPYGLALARDDSAARLYGRSHTGTVAYDLTGRGCEAIRDRTTAAGCLAGVVDWVTRIDYAVDIRTATRPADFANDRSHRAFRSIGFVKSDSGETVYVGSPKSDRFCRVYRYNPPHPRADLLRVEFVFRRRLAKDFAVSYCEADSDETLCAVLGNTYGFGHKDWQPGVVTDEKLRVPITTLDQGKTLMWLYKQVIPAMQRLMTEGALDMTDFLETVYAPFQGPDGSEDAQQ